MMSIIYLSIVFVCFIVSLFTYKYNPAFRLFPWIMGVTLVVDGVAGFLAYILVINPFPIYHFSAPLLSCLTAAFFYRNLTGLTVKKILIIVMVIYVVTSLGLSFYFYQLTDFPGLSVNMAGVILIACSLYVLLTLDPIHNIPIYEHPLAWICIGIIIYNCGTFFLNGLYNYLVVSESQSRVLIHRIINNGLNCVMYVCFTVGLIFSHRLKKYDQKSA